MSAEDIKKKQDTTKTVEVKKNDTKKKSKFRAKKKEKKIVINGKSVCKCYF